MQAQENLESAGGKVVMRMDRPMAAEGPAPEAMKDYGQVVVALERAVKKDNPMLAWLAQVKAPMMVVLY